MREGGENQSGKLFFKILRPIVNKNTVKLSFCTMTSMAGLISGQNKSKLATANNLDDTNQRPCRCQENPCPLQGLCESKYIVYKATLEISSQNKFIYKGITSRKFIEIFTNHKRSFKHGIHRVESCLSQQVWREKDAGHAVKVTFEKLKESSSYRPGGRRCNLCLDEIISIIFHEGNPYDGELLNSKNELYSSCRHRSRWKVGI